MQCLVLAGGRGTRMGRWTESRPKALIPVLGRPFAERQIEWLAAQGVGDVVCSIGYRGDMIRAALGDGRRWGISIRYVDEGSQLRGTAGALRLAADAGVLDWAFLVLYGDSYLSVDVAEVWRAFLARGYPALMTVFENHGQWDRSNVVFHPGDAGNRIELYDKRAQPPALPTSARFEFIDYGLSVLTRRVVEGMVPAGTVADLSDLFHALSVQGDLGGFAVGNRFYEIGSEEGLRRLEEHLRSTRAPASTPGPSAGATAT